MTHIRVQSTMPSERADTPFPPASGYGPCSNRMVCHCPGYRGKNRENCQSCGCPFGAHLGPESKDTVGRTLVSLTVGASPCL